jgi:beta-phosphoglucomutase-like phosphatase (HAD superfamily)
LSLPSFPFLPCFFVRFSQSEQSSDPPPPLAELRKLGLEDFSPSDILVFEDAPSGVASGNAAGCKVLAVGTGQPLEKVRTFPATVRVVDLTRVEVVSASPESVTLRIRTLEEDDAAGLTKGVTGGH